MVWNVCWIIFDVVVNCAVLWRWSYPLYLCEHVICIILRHGYDKCYVHWERMRTWRGCTISRDVFAHRDEYYTIIEGRVVRSDRWMDRYVPHGSRIERQWVCITRSDMHHYTWHYIPLHCTYLSLVNLISCFADLLIAFLRNLWLINIELVIADI